LTLLSINNWALEDNSNLDKNPKIINELPYDKGWMLKVSSPEPLDALMNAEAYSNYLKVLGIA